MSPSRGQANSTCSHLTTMKIKAIDYFFKLIGVRAEVIGAHAATSRPTPVASRDHDQSVQNQGDKLTKDQQREILYDVIRTEVSRIGLLVANYKYKVLNIDSTTTKRIVILDLPRNVHMSANDTAMAEKNIKRKTSALNGTSIHAVYWRFAEPAVSLKAAAPSVAPLAPFKPRPRATPIYLGPDRRSSSVKDAIEAQASPASVQRLPREIQELDLQLDSRNFAMPDFADTLVDDSVVDATRTQFGKI